MSKLLISEQIVNFSNILIHVNSVTAQKLQHS